MYIQGVERGRMLDAGFKCSCVLFKAPAVTISAFPWLIQLYQIKPFALTVRLIAVQAYFAACSVTHLIYCILHVESLARFL